MAAIFEGKITGEHEPKTDAVHMTVQPDGIPTRSGNFVQIMFQDLPEVVAAEVGRRGDRVRITIERIPG